MDKLRKAVWIGLLGAVLAWAGGDPWNSKPYQSWDREDVLKVLNHSPWSKAIQVSARWKSAGPGMEMPGGSGPTGGGGESRSGEPTTMGGGRQQPQPGGYGGQGGPDLATPPQVWFQARWLSARVVREGLARSAVLNGSATEAQAEQFIAQNPADYEIALIGPDMTPFEKLDENALKQSAYLELKKKKRERIPPSSVQIQRGKDGKVSAVVFSFPKTQAGGEPVIAPDEKDAKFVCDPAKNLKMEFSFELKKMVSQQGRDL